MIERKLYTLQLYGDEAQYGKTLDEVVKLMKDATPDIKGSRILQDGFLRQELVNMGVGKLKQFYERMQVLRTE